MLITSDMLVVFQITIGVLILLFSAMYWLSSLGTNPTEMMSAIRNKVNIKKYIAKYSEEVIHFKVEDGFLSESTSPLELSVILTRFLGVQLTPSDFAYIAIKQTGGDVQLTFKMSKQCRLFYGKASIAIIQRTKIRTSSVIKNTVLDSLG